MGYTTLFDEHSIALAFNALATLTKTPDEYLIKRLCARAKTLTNFTAQAISNVLDALAKMGVDDSFLVDKFCRDASQKLGDFTTQGLANVLTALSKLRGDHKELVGRLCLEVRAKISKFKPQELVTTMSALAKMKLPEDQALLKALGDRSLATIDGFTCSIKSGRAADASPANNIIPKDANRNGSLRNCFRITNCIKHTLLL